jgi:tight adherence protein C
MEIVLLVLLLLAASLAVRFLSRAAAIRRVGELIATPDTGPVNDGSQGRLAAWLYRAGYRAPSAAAKFLAATAGGAALGLLLGFALTRLGVIAGMVNALAGIPGAVGETLGYVAEVTPYILFVMLAMAPTLAVRAARRERIAAIEQDLPPTLELLATLAEAGLALDSAIARITESRAVEARPLSQEFGIYQRDLLGGITRFQALRMLAGRAEVTSVSIFVSALIQAEQVGASLAETLRTQANDLRDRRKLQALVLAQALPVKLTFPLIACFLPGIFFVVLGPVLNQLVDVVDAVIQRR